MLQRLRCPSVLNARWNVPERAERHLEGVTDGERGCIGWKKGGPADAVDALARPTPRAVRPEPPEGVAVLVR